LITKQSSAAAVKKLEEQRQCLRSWLRAYMAKVDKLKLGSSISSQLVPGDAALLQANEAMLKAACNEVAQLDPEFDLLNTHADNDNAGDLSNLDDSTDPVPDDDLLSKPEELTVWLPSCNPHHVQQELCTIELELRTAQAMELVQNIRAGIGEKSVLLRFLV
jgi:hypothetical protein